MGIHESMKPQWCLFLVGEKRARIIRGEPGNMREVAAIPGDADEVCARLFAEFEAEPFDYLAIATPEDRYTGIVNSLHSHVLVKLAGRFDCDAEHSDVAAAEEAARPLMHEMKRKREEAVLDQLRMDLGKGTGAVATSADVTRALEEKRVGTLILAPGNEAGTRRVIDLAIAQDAEVIVLDESPDELDDYDGIAALLRF